MALQHTQCPNNLGLLVVTGKCLLLGGNSLHSGMLSCMSPHFCSACWLSPEGNETMLAMFLTGGRNASPAGSIALVRGEGKKINEFTKAGFLAA